MVLATFLALTAIVLALPPYVRAFRATWQEAMVDFRIGTRGAADAIRAHREAQERARAAQGRNANNARDDRIHNSNAGHQGSRPNSRAGAEIVRCVAIQLILRTTYLTHCTAMPPTQKVTSTSAV